MIKPTRSHQAGFTLIELLTVIAIIGILAAIIIPTVSKVRETAQRAVDASNLSQIGKAALIYAADNNDNLPNPTDTKRPIAGTASNYLKWFGLIAKYASFNDPKLLVSKSDNAVDITTTPNTIIDPLVTTAPTVMSTFATLPALSFNVVGGLNQSKDTSTVPVAFTRGLKADGKWTATGATDDDPTIGVYKGDGGHAVFVGGNVKYFSGSINGELTNSKGATDNIRTTVPNRSTVKIYGKDPGNSVASEAGADPVAP